MANKLELFDKQIDDLLSENPDFNLGKSGVAKIISVENTTLFSASMYLKNGSNDNIPAPLEFVDIFKNNKLPDFEYYTVEILTFKSDSKLPDPKWRIQVKYI
jgi:hypothetical protein